MPLLRIRRETNKTDTLLEIFNDNLSDIPSEVKDVDDCFDDSRDDSTNSEITSPVRKNKVVVFSSDSNTDEASVGLKLTHHHAYRCL